MNAGIRITLSNDAAVTQQATVSGTRLSGPDDGRATTYGPIAQSVASKADATVDVPALAPGIWLHRVSVAATGQQQFRQSLVVDDPNRSSALDWTLFATVLTVNQAADDGDGRCDTTCTLRDAVMKANKAKRPVLIVFDHTALGTPAEVESKDQRIIINSPGLTIDGTDEQGNPSPLVDFSQRTYPVRITLRGTQDGAAAGTADRARLSVHPELRRHALRVGAQGELPRTSRRPRVSGPHQDLLRQSDADPDGRGLAGHARRHLSARRRRPRAARRGDAEGDDRSRDEQGLRQAGERPARPPAHPIVVTNSEISYCLDRGVKVQEDYLLLTDNWIHNNLRCAPVRHRAATARSRRSATSSRRTG